MNENPNFSAAIPSVEAVGDAIQTLGGYVRDRRIELGMDSRKALAIRIYEGQQVYVTPDDINNIESGRTKKPRQSRLTVFANALETSPEHLFELAGYGEKKEFKFAASDPRCEIVEALEQVDGKGIIYIRRVVQRYLELNPPGQTHRE